MAEQKSTSLVPYIPSSPKSYVVTGGNNSWVAPVAILAVVGVGGFLIWQSLKKKTTVWQACLTSLVTSPVLTYTTPLSLGWQVCLTSLVTSPSITVGTPLSLGWQACLTSLVTSPSLTVGLPLLLGWQSCLSSLITSPTLSLSGIGYNITVNVSPSGAGTVLPRSGLFPLGYYDFTAASYSGVNDFNHWEINGVNRGSVNPLHIYVNGDATIVAFFGASQYSLTTSVSPSNAGFIEQTPAGSSFPANTFVTLRAYAWDNYQFDTWIDPSEIIPSSQLMFNPIQVSMNRDIELIAHFIPVTPPPSGEPVFPAPGTPGDQQTWYWVVLTTDLGNWYSSYDCYKTGECCNSFHFFLFNVSSVFIF